MNDWHDRKTDAINRPNRFLVTAKWSALLFWGIIASLFILALILSVYLSVVTHHIHELWILPAVFAALILYARWFKQYKPIGNLLVATLIASLVPLIIISEWPALKLVMLNDPSLFDSFLNSAVTYTFLIFFINLAREVTKDLEDMKGDSETGIRALPQLFGVKNSKIIVSVLFVVTVLTDWLFFIYSDYEMIVGIISLIIFSVFVMLSLRLVKASDSRHYRYISQWLKWIMVLGIVQLCMISLG